MITPLCLVGIDADNALRCGGLFVNGDQPDGEVGPARAHSWTGPLNSLPAQDVQAAFASLQQRAWDDGLNGEPGISLTADAGGATRLGWLGVDTDGALRCGHLLIGGEPRVYDWSPPITALSSLSDNDQTTIANIETDIPAPTGFAVPIRL